MLIDCDQCQMQGTDHCRDCIVTAMLEPREAGLATVIDAAEERALRAMAGVGLVPEIRMKPRPQTA